MKIGFTGAHSVGKTTTAEEVASISGIPIIPEIAREMINNGFKILSKYDKPNLQTQYAILGKQIFEEQCLYPNFISDRTLIDVLAYTLCFCKNVDLSSEDYYKLVDFVSAYVKSMYDVIFYLPIQFDLVDDGLRATDDGERLVIDSAIISIIGDNDIKVMTLSGNREERVAQVMAYIENYSTQV